MMPIFKKKLHLKVSRKLFYLLIVPCVALVIFGVSYLIFRGDENRGGYVPEVAKALPSDTIKDFYRFLNAGDIDKARTQMTVEHLLSPTVSTADANKMLYDLLKAEKEFAQRCTMNIVAEKISGDYAVLRVELTHPQDKRKFPRVFYLAKHDNFWYIASVGNPPTSWYTSGNETQ